MSTLFSLNFSPMLYVILQWLLFCHILCVCRGQIMLPWVLVPEFAQYPAVILYPGDLFRCRFGGLCLFFISLYSVFPQLPRALRVGTPWSR